MKSTKIQWTDATWNIAVGCTKVDEDCKYCYMYRGSLNDTRYNPKKVRKTKGVFHFPLTFRMEKSECWDGRPLIFTSSLTDVFHPDCDSFREEMWDIIRQCPQFIFQILTKRPERILDHLPEDWANGWDNVWLGTSVGSPKGYNRIISLADPAIKARVKFLSMEPLHEYVWLNRQKISYPKQGINLLPHFQWVIVGGESGNETGKYRYRPCYLNWIVGIVDDCQSAGVPVFVKQLGTYLSKQLGLKDRHGGDINEWPEEIRVREFPWDMEWRGILSELPAVFVDWLKKNRKNEPK